MKSVSFSILRSIAMLAVLFGGTAILQCATTPAKPTTSTLDAGQTPALDAGPTTDVATVVGCDKACANAVKLSCQHSDACPGICAALQSQKLVDCMIRAPSCDFMDTCNQPQE